MISELDRVSIKLAIPIAVAISVGYLVHGERGIFITGAMLLMIVIGASVYFLFEMWIPSRKSIVNSTNGDCNVNIECSEFCVTRKPLRVIVNDKETVTTLFRVSKITLNLVSGDKITFVDNSSESSIYEVEDHMNLYVWIEPLLPIRIQVKRFFDVPPKDKAYDVYKNTDKLIRKITVPIIIFGTVAIIVMLWKANIL